MSAQVTNEVQRDALYRFVSENAAPVVVICDGRPFILTEDERGDVYAHSYRMEDEDRNHWLADLLPLPLTVAWQPEPAAWTEDQRTQPFVTAGFELMNA